MVCCSYLATAFAHKPRGVGHLDAMVMVKLSVTPIMPVVHTGHLPLLDDGVGAPADADRDPVVPRPQGPVQINPPP